MRRAYFNSIEHDPIRHSYDVGIIVRIVQNQGYELSPYDAHLAWSAYSDSYCAGWMILPKNDYDLWKCIEPYLSFEPIDDR